MEITGESTTQPSENFHNIEMNNDDSADEIEDWVEVVDDSEDSVLQSNDEDSESDTGTGEEQPFGGKSMQQCIADWSVDRGLTHEDLNTLFPILNAFTPYRFPKDARTLLGTYKNGPASKQIVPITGGQLWYHGIGKCLQEYYGDVQPKVPNISINVSIDGLPLHNSGPTQFWPILMNIWETPEVPCLVVGIFCGPSKPSILEEYLRPLVDELITLSDNGIIIAGTEIRVHVRAFIADSPARSFIKGVINFNGKHGCQKCVVKGEYSRASHRLFFRGVDAQQRTDEEFRSMDVYIGHHKERTPLLEIPRFDVIKDVVIADRLHLIDLGVTKKLLKGWMSGKMGNCTKWSHDTCLEINALLDNLRFPSEIHRKPRSVELLPRWKGTELSNFLHYSSVVVLKGRISDSEYNHFMLYFCAITLFSSVVYKAHWPEAAQLLDKFVVEFSTVYGIEYTSSNIHNLHHIYEDVNRFGPLHTISSYPFESKLGRIKKSLRHGYKSLEQCVNRLAEQSRRQKIAIPVPTTPLLIIKGDKVQLRLDNSFTLREGHRDEWFLTKNEIIVKFSSAAQVGSLLSIFGKYFTCITESYSYYNSPFMKNIYEAKMSNLSTTNRVFQIAEVKCKMVAIKTDIPDSFLFIPLLHTLIR
uniref:Transposase domain-containing protein n=1 Tax=Anopheles atroparvus TaxID=41427 RepID=A0AAG5D0U7_ANOAO